MGHAEWLHARVCLLGIAVQARGISQYSQAQGRTPPCQGDSYPDVIRFRRTNLCCYSIVDTTIITLYMLPSSMSPIFFLLVWISLVRTWGSPVVIKMVPLTVYCCWADEEAPRPSSFLYSLQILIYRWTVNLWKKRNKRTMSSVSGIGPRVFLSCKNEKRFSCETGKKGKKMWLYEQFMNKDTFLY